MYVYHLQVGMQRVIGISETEVRGSYEPFHVGARTDPGSSPPAAKISLMTNPSC